MGIHGLPHWGRVMENGRRLAQAAGADPLVVDLFALFHDARRRNEGRDPGHGARGAELARELRDALPPLTEGQLDLLCEACTHHTDGRVHADPTIGVCWDADRLDLWRVGVRPSGDLLSTAAAREPAVLARTRERSSEYVVPGFVMEEWMRVVGE
ncbi:MAG: HD domain-containing protein [Gemmatimonadota bacterium]